MPASHRMGIAGVCSDKDSLLEIRLRPELYLFSFETVMSMRCRIEVLESIMVGR